MADTQTIEMTARQLRALAESMGHLDIVEVKVSERIAREYWSKRASVPEIGQRMEKAIAGGAALMKVRRAGERGHFVTLTAQECNDIIYLIRTARGGE